jgi:hypothetical protein
MAEKHKSKYKKPENKKPTYRKDIKDYTMDDKDEKLNPKSTGEKQSNVLRKTDKSVVDTGEYDVKWNADDRLYNDLEDGEYDPKHSAKVLKKRQDDEEKDMTSTLKDKIENLTREQRERIIREYIRKKIATRLAEQIADPNAPVDPLTDPNAAPIDPLADPAAAPTDPAAAPAPTDPMAAAPTDPMAAPAPDASATPAPATPPVEIEGSTMEKFVEELRKEAGPIGQIKSIAKVFNSLTAEAEPADKKNFYKYIKSLADKKLDHLNFSSTPDAVKSEK